MSNTANNPTKVITGPNTRWSYCNAWEAKAINGGTPKFSVSLIIPKSDKKTIAKIEEAIKAAYREGEAKLKGNGRSVPALSVLKTPLRDGDVERPDDEAYADSYFVNANSSTAPGIVDADRQPMLHSLEAQVSYYSGLIQSHSGWEYAGVYADEARTGTKDTRENFLRMLADCRAGKIDMVLTKSISRFARNTVTLLETVRELKQIGVDVYFEEQNIHSLSTDGELMLTVLASYAQEESRSASENQKWRIKKNFEEGKPWSSTLLGYRNVNGGYEVVPEEAETVRMIFGWYLEGMGATAIRAEENRTLVFCLKNGNETVKQWQEHEVVHICTEEQRRQISLKNSGRKRTEEERRKQSERMKEYWKGRRFPEEQRRRQSEKMKAYWNDHEASDAHRQTVGRMMKEMRAGKAAAGKEGQDG